MEKYEGWELHHEAEVEFAEEQPAGEQGPSVTLDITTLDEAEFKLWDLYPMTPLQVTLSIPMKATSILEAYACTFKSLVFV